jgi:hypothetical protein
VSECIQGSVMVQGGEKGGRENRFSESSGRPPSSTVETTAGAVRRKPVGA